MSVPVGERGEGKLEVIVMAQKLATYTIKITKNKKVFTPEYNDAITADIIHTAKDIFVSCWEANNIRVNKNPERAKERLKLQEYAAQQCNNLLTLIQLAQPIFHLTGKRVRYWSIMTLGTRMHIRKWNETDRKRYSF